MRKLLALLLIASMPAAGVAQSLAPASLVNSNGQQLDAQRPAPALLDQILGTRANLLAAANAQKVPLWSTPDGRILAMVAASGNAYPTLPKSPQIGVSNEWRLVDVTSLVSGGLLLRMTDNATAHFELGRIELDRPGMLAPTALPALQCNGLDADTSCVRTGAALAHGGELRIGTSWLATDNLDLDLSYGLSWLRRDSTAPAASQAAAYGVLPTLNNPALPALIIPGAEFANVQNSSISALGRLHLNDNQALDLGASLSRIQLSIPGAAPLTSLNQAAVSLGMEYGSFTGTVTGRMLGPADSYSASVNNPRWTGLDVGISWRTPWRGLFSVGAQNLFSSGSLPLLNNSPAAREIDPNQARVPYVQYHQDL